MREKVIRLLMLLGSNNVAEALRQHDERAGSTLEVLINEVNGELLRAPAEAAELARRLQEIRARLAPKFGLESNYFEDLSEESQRLAVATCEVALSEGMIPEGKSILKPWVATLGLRHQGVLLTAMRGCDGIAKEDPSKPIIRAIRCATCVPYDERELTERRGFMYYGGGEELLDDAHAFAKSLDGYPLHFVLHVAHALEVIGYCHPDIGVPFEGAYRTLVRRLHLEPESRESMEARLTEDRVASGTVAG